MLSDCTWGGGKPKLDRILNGAFLLDFQACGDPGQTMDAGYLRITATLLSLRELSSQNPTCLARAVCQEA